MSTKKTNDILPNAATPAIEAAYLEALGKVVKQVSVLQNIAKNHRLQKRLDYGHVGDMSMVANHLEDLLSGFSAALKA